MNSVNYNLVEFDLRLILNLTVKLRLSSFWIQQFIDNIYWVELNTKFFYLPPES